MDIKTEILDYIKCNETSGALLLTGKWGCGKSYLAKQIAKELNNEKKAAIAVISLFGLDSISMINKRVKDEYTAFLLGLMAKSGKKALKGLATLAKDGLAVAGIASPDTTGLSAASQGLSSALSYDIFGFIEVKNTVGKNDNMRKFVLVFDDLERCGISNKQDLFGVINEYVENKQIKVIIIAEEEKISGKEYKEYKEKLISRSIRMSADYNLLIDSIINNYNETSVGYKSFLSKNAVLLKQVFFESKTDNIRTLKCILADFERVYATWNETGITTDNMKWSLYTFSADVFISRTPQKEEKVSEKQSSYFVRREKEEPYSIKGKNNSSFSSFGRWIKEGSWDKESFIEELTNKYCKKEKTPLFRFLTYGFWDLQQQDIDEGLPQAVKLAYAGRLSKDQLISLIGKVHALNENNIILPIDIDYQHIEEGFDKRFVEIQKGTIKEPNSYSFIEKSNVDAEATELYKKIERFDDRIVAYENRKKYLKYLELDGEIPYYSLKGLYIEEFDNEWLDLFIKKYKGADNSIKREMLLSILNMTFDYKDYSTDENIKRTVENFKKLAITLENMETDDSITKKLNKLLAEKIRDNFKIEC